MRIVFTRNGYRFLWLSSLPVILLHFALLNYSAHDFTTLYASLFLSVLVGILYDKIFHGQVERRRSLNIALGITVLLMIGQFYFINRPGEISLRGDRYDRYEQAGLKIAETANENEVVFLLGQKPMPELVWYAKRNIQQVNSVDEALNWLRTHDRNQGRLFTLDETGVYQEDQMIIWEPSL
jgi:hypothetical protein